jgi:hypothetical protein
MAERALFVPQALTRTRREMHLAPCVQRGPTHHLWVPLSRPSASPARRALTRTLAPPWRLTANVMRDTLGAMVGRA